MFLEDGNVDARIAGKWREIVVGLDRIDYIASSM